jgi:hypothetical protein
VVLLGESAKLVKFLCLGSLNLFRLFLYAILIGNTLSSFKTLANATLLADEFRIVSLMAFCLFLCSRKLISSLEFTSFFVGETF